MMCVYFGLKICEWKGISFSSKKSEPRGQKWLCVPCGYIYDPVIGDEDSGIVPGTDFLDIPANWKCPICGVTKSDFVLYDTEQTELGDHDARIIEKTFLNPTTLKIVLETSEILGYIPGQFTSFVYEDGEGQFLRSYSIAESDGKKLTFLIKLKK